MSIYNDVLLPHILEIPKRFCKGFDDVLKVAFEQITKFEEDYQNGREKARDEAQKNKNLMRALQSISEDEVTVEPPKNIERDTEKSSISSTEPSVSETDRPSTESNGSRRRSKKRSKNEVDGLTSPEQDKRPKRNASVRAQSIITKQVNVNLTEKLRREEPKSARASRSRRKNNSDKENLTPELTVQIKQEKQSIAPEPMVEDSLPVNIEVKKEVDKDGFTMPAVPVPLPRKAPAKDKSLESDDDGKKTRNTRNKKKSDMPPPPVPSARSTRASSRASSRATQNLDNEEPAPVDARPKRTRTKKKASDSSTAREVEKEVNQQVPENGGSSPSDKPRPKRTRRAQKAAEKEKPEEVIQDVPKEVPMLEITKQEWIPQPEVSSPILVQKKTTKTKAKATEAKTKKTAAKAEESEAKAEESGAKAEESGTKTKESGAKSKMMNEIVDQSNVDVIDNAIKSNIDSDLDKNINLVKTVNLPVERTEHVNETFSLDSGNRESMVIDKPTTQAHTINDVTVVIEKDGVSSNITDDNSIMTDDRSEPDSKTPPPTNKHIQPTSAVKEKVQQFEELASRVTRTKTRAMAKKEDDPDTRTPPDQMKKPVLSEETLKKMNSMIFNGKPMQQISASASKPRCNIPVTKPTLSASASKLSSASRLKDAADDIIRRDKEDARRKKEAMLDAKRELQKRKREEKMAAAAAAREAAERERQNAIHKQELQRAEKQSHADQGKIDKMKEVERKKQELARKVAETEERRRLEEAARLQRIELEQKRAQAARQRQHDEQEATKKETAQMAKEIERRQKEYIQKQKMDMRLHKINCNTPAKNYKMDPVYMADGFQYIQSDDEKDPIPRKIPSWSHSKVYRPLLLMQSHVKQSIIDTLFSVRVQSVDLRELFPGIDSRALVRTSSAVWRTPPGKLNTVHE